MSELEKARVVGINHIALEVGDIDEALEFYGQFLEFGLRSKSQGMAFIELGDQFVALIWGREQPRDDERHFGLVVNDKAAVARTLEKLGIKIVSDRFLDFYDPWGNRIEIVGYEGIQFTKADYVLEGMGLEGFEGLEKTDDAVAELANKGMTPR